MTPEPTPLVTVLPCDRQCAVDTLSGIVSELTIEHILLGRYDTDDMVQSPARHRLAALEEAAKVAEAFTNDHPHGPAITPDRYRRDIAAAIRELSNKTGKGSTEDVWLVPGPCWGDGASGWVSEVQIIGGHEVIATVYADTQQLAAERRDTVLAALALSNKGGRDGE